MHQTFSAKSNKKGPECTEYRYWSNSCSLPTLYFALSNMRKYFYLWNQNKTIFCFCPRGVTTVPFAPFRPADAVSIGWGCKVIKMTRLCRVPTTQPKLSLEYWPSTLIYLTHDPIWKSKSKWKKSYLCRLVGPLDEHIHTPATTILLHIFRRSYRKRRYLGPCP